jgi:hypothetical protein
LGVGPPLHWPTSARCNVGDLGETVNAASRSAHPSLGASRRAQPLLIHLEERNLCVGSFCFTTVVVPFGTYQEIVAPFRMRYARARLPGRNPASIGSSHASQQWSSPSSPSPSCPQVVELAPAAIGRGTSICTSPSFPT